MSDRLRGKSASPADVQNTGSTVEEGTNPPGADTTGTPATASPSGHQPSRKKGTAGKKGTALPKQSGPATATSAGPGATPAPSNTPTGDQEQGLGGGITTGDVDAEESTETQAIRGVSTTGQPRGQPDATQPMTQPDQEGSLPAQRGATHATEECETAPPELIAPEIIGRNVTGRHNRKPTQCCPCA